MIRTCAALALAAALGGCAAPQRAPLFGAPLPAFDDAPDPPARPPARLGVSGGRLPPPPAPTRLRPVAPEASGVWQRIARGSAIAELPLDAALLQAHAARPDAVSRALGRAEPYLRQIVEQLDRRGLPLELALLPMVESGFDVAAVSPAAAAGIWQLMPQTARDQGLRVDWLRDERHDPLAATDAALNHLAALHRRLGDWHLALAAYNCGESCVARALQRVRAVGLEPGWDHAAPLLPQETQSYVPRFLALRAFLRGPAARGLTLPAVDDAAPVVRVRLDRDADLDSIARLAGAPFALVAQLNAGVVRQVLIGGSREVWLPHPHALRLQAALRAQHAPLMQLKALAVQRDTPVAELARRHGIDEPRLRRINAIPAALSVVRSGTVFVPLAPGESPLPLGTAPLQPLRLQGEEALAARSSDGRRTEQPGDPQWLEGGWIPGRLFLPGRRGP